MAKRRKRSKRRRERRPGEQSAPAPQAPGPPLERRARRTGRSALLVFAGLAVLAALALLWRPGTPPPAPPLNVVVVTADTLRADKLGAYGGTVETPNLDALAASGILFENAYTTAPVTLPAHASLFTGTYPFHHGVRENGGLPLAEESVTLAEVLKETGYRTGAFVGAFVLDGRFGLEQGFERYGDELTSGTERPGGEVLDEALAWMEGVAGERFFSWIHLFDPHIPYEPPEPYRGRYGPESEGLYEGEVAYVDELVGKLLHWLDARGLSDSTLIVFVGDHGESLGEHGELTHGFFVYSATMRVPLLLRSPNFAKTGLRVLPPVRVVDVMPTVLELAGVETPSSVQGRNLVPLASDGPGAERVAYGESWSPRHYGWSELESLRTADTLFIDAPRPELYDLATDPAEERNLAPSRAATVREFRERLTALKAELGGAAVPEPPSEALVDPEAREKLAALGYLGSGSAPRVDPARELPDPKDKIDVFNRIREAAAAADAGHAEQGLSLLESVVEEDPDIVEAYNLMGKLSRTLGRPEEAIASYREALERDPTYAPAIFGLAETYESLGRVEDAAAGLERLLELDPSAAPAATRLARLRLDRGDPEGAIDALKDVDAPVLEAEARIATGALDEARKLLERALASDPERVGAHYLLAVALEREGDLPGAIRAYQNELEVAPEDYRTHFDLAKLLRQQGRGAEALEHLERTIAANPSFAVGHLYLADALLEAGEAERAVELAREGLSLGPEPALAPLGHFILADAYSRLGRREDAEREMQIGARLQQEATGAPPQPN